MIYHKWLLLCGGTAHLGIAWLVTLECIAAGAAARAPAAAPAFAAPEAAAGPLTITIGDPGEVKALERLVPVTVTLRNASNAPLAGTLRLSVTDDWRVQGDPLQTWTLAPKASRTLRLAVVAGKGTHAALYPVHARAEFRTGAGAAAGAAASARATLILSVSPEALIAAEPSPRQLPVLRAPERGSLRLDTPNVFQPQIAVAGWPAATPKPPGWQGSDAQTGASVQRTEADRGERRRALGVHPPYRTGWGNVLLDYRVALPARRPIFLQFATAIRDHDPATEPPSDGVDFRVFVGDGGDLKAVFARFSAANRWEPAQVDLSQYAGREVTLRLFTGPGPAHNTACDQAFWAQPTLLIGPPPKREPQAQAAARRQRALQAAQAAAAGQPGAWAWPLRSEAAPIGAALVPGPNGIADAFLAFADATRSVVFDGFHVEIDSEPLAAGEAGLVCQRVESRVAAGRGTLRHQVLTSKGPLDVQTEIWAEKGALRVAFTLPGVKRDSRGEPRFTALLIGPASEKARRVYAGFGNVLQDPGRFDLRAGGFHLSTRHAGMDFENGLSLVQATDIFPDFLRVDPETRHYALAAHQDTTFSFVPSTRGAFAAARVYRGLAGFRPAPGLAGILGRMCLDQWGGDYREAANGIERAARYGLTDAVFVKHVWQRWGYDYRLPEIYPPQGDFDDFRAMADACKRHGILFCPHDNYIDFYPDAAGFSYNHIVFNADGTPQKAWYNKSREAQSYRWLPTAFFPWLEDNLKQVQQGFAPTSYFVDVFAAVAPFDFYDRQGRFYPKTVTTERWGAAFDRIRDILGNNAPTISEAGHDALIGHLDAGQSDHSGWSREGTPDDAHFRWSMPAADAERVPWHDMATHGAFVLLGGGLGPRYAGGQDAFLHGYGSDDYLSTTVLGGRNPMSDGPFSRRAVMTYWLLHDLCARLARSEMLSHEFAGDDIHRQIVRFGEGGSVHVNRGKTDWQVENQTLPPYGFVARAGGHEASVTRRDGVIAGLARSPDLLFADARPDVSSAERPVRPRVVGVEDTGNRRFRVRVDWEVLQPVPAGYQPFLHFVDEKSGGDGIAFQGGLALDSAKLARLGTYTSVADVPLPPTVKAPATFAIRYGLYRPGAGGPRLPLQGPVDDTGRARGGTIVVEDANPFSVRWQPEPPDPDAVARNARLNLGGKIVDFGPVATNGAFRLQHSGGEWTLTPLPSSPVFQVEIRLDRLQAGGRKVQSVRGADITDKITGDVPFRQEGQLLRFETDGAAFAYRIRFTP